jgi:hypothetical protein
VWLPVRRQDSHNRPAAEDGIAMFKLIAFLAAAIPVILLVRAVFFKRSTAMQRAFADFRRQVDLLASAILVCVACVVLYSIGKLIYSFWN